MVADMYGSMCYVTFLLGLCATRLEIQTLATAFLDSSEAAHAQVQDSACELVKNCFTALQLQAKLLLLCISPLKRLALLRAGPVAASGELRSADSEDAPHAETLTLMHSNDQAEIGKCEQQLSVPMLHGSWVHRRSKTQPSTSTCPSRGCRISSCDLPQQLHPFKPLGMTLIDLV
jgi:hypothetical protein